MKTRHNPSETRIKSSGLPPGFGYLGQQWYDAGHRDVQLSVTLERSASSTAGGADLIPGLALWQGKEDLGNYSSRYVNGIDSTNWNEWNGGGACAPAGTCSYFPTLAQTGLDGNVWTATDDRTKPTGLAKVMTNLTLTEGGNNYFTLVMGGNADLASTGAAKNFSATVALWLFGSGLAGMVGLARRRATA